MAVLGTQIREQFGRLGLSTETLGAQLGELTPKRLRRLERLSAGDAEALVASNRFAAGVRDRRISIPKAFSNLAPSAALARQAPFVGATYGSEETNAHASASDPFPHLLHGRRSRAARMGLALAKRPELRERVGVTLGAIVLDDQRTDGVISIERSPRNSRRALQPAPAAQGASLPPPTQSFSNASIYQIMMGMDQAILHEAARLGLGQGSGIGGTPGYLEAMGLWSLTPDDGDPSAWMGFGQGGGTQAGAQAMSGVPQPAPTSPGGPTGGTVGPENVNSGLDVDIMRLKRMIDKKTQMMELYSQSLSKYNSSANAIIGNMKG